MGNENEMDVINDRNDGNDRGWINNLTGTDVFLLLSFGPVGVPLIWIKNKIF